MLIQHVSDLCQRLTAHRADAVWAIGVGVPLGIALGSAVISSSLSSALTGLVLAGIVPLVAYRTASADDRVFVMRTALLAFALRAAAGAVLFVGSTWIGRGGAVTGDDGAYADLAWAFVRYLKGDPHPPDVPPIWNGQAYLFGTFVYLESALFYVIGREMLAMQFINAAVAALTYVVLFDMSRTVFGPRPARLVMLLAAVFPSLVLWSSLNLKEALVVAGVTTVLWALMHMAWRFGAALLAISYVLIFLLESMRGYSFLGLLIVLPIGVAIAPGLERRRRAALVLVAASLSLALLATSQYSPFVDLRYTIENIDVVRRAQGESARTAFVEPRPVAVRRGETFYVPTAAPNPSGSATNSSGSPTPTRAPVVYYVQPGTRVVLASSTPVSGVQGPVVVESSVVTVQPGDIVIVGTPDTTPAPRDASRALPFVDQREGGQGATLDVVAPPHTESEALVLNRTLTHIPTGLAHAFFAPFPWEVHRLTEAALLPETLLWYALLLSAVWTLWRRRGAWRVLAPVVLYLGGVFALFSLLEGNVGTLLRHRAMLVPYVVMLAAPTLLALLRRLPSVR